MNFIKAIRQYRLVSLKLGSYHFNPGVFSTLITVLFLYLMISLGFWQMQRAEFKNTLQQKILERKSLSAVGFDDLSLSVEDRRYIPVKFSAEFDSQHVFLLDNKTFNGRVGYHVFTPVKISESRAMLIARGFVAMGKSREQLPIIETPSGKIEFSGLLDLPPSRTLVLAENVQQTERWPVLLQYVDLNEISQLLGYQLYDMVLWLDEDKAQQGSTKLEYDIPVLNLNAAKNSGYAFQWFAMSTALLIIYLVVNIKKVVLNNEGN